MRQRAARKLPSGLNRLFRKTKTFIRRAWDFYVRISGSKKARAIITLAILFLIAGYLYIWVLRPDSRSIQAPVVVASCNCDTLPTLSVKVLDKKKLQIMAVYSDCDTDWSHIEIQAPEDATDVDVQVEEFQKGGTDITTKLADQVKNLKDSLRSGFYFMLTKEFLRRHMKLISNSRISFSYVMPEGIYHKSYSKYYLSLVFIPANTKKPQQNYPVPVDVLAPQSFLLTSSIPSAYRIFLLEDGISYTVDVIKERTGILLNFDDLEAEASKEIIVLLASTILGFIIGFVLEKIIGSDK